MSLRNNMAIIATFQAILWMMLFGACVAIYMVSEGNEGVRASAILAGCFALVNLLVVGLIALADRCRP